MTIDRVWVVQAPVQGVQGIRVNQLTKSCVETNENGRHSTSWSLSFKNLKFQVRDILKMTIANTKDAVVTESVMDIIYVRAIMRLAQTASEMWNIDQWCHQSELLA